MQKPPKVVPIEEQKYRLIARDTKSQRVILGIGSERIAIDFISRISKLSPATGDQPAAVLPIKKDQRRQKSQRIERKKPAEVERMMKLQDVILKAMAKKISWLAAAEIAGVSDRTMRRLRQRYQESGYTGLFDQRWVGGVSIGFRCRRQSWCWACIGSDTST